MNRRQKFLQYFDDIDAAGLRQRSLFLRYFEDFKAAGLDPVAVMDLAFSLHSSVFLRQTIAGMKLFRDSGGRAPMEFFWGLENASPETRDQIFNLLNWNDPARLAGELDRIASCDRRKTKKFWAAQHLQAIENVDKVLVPALREILPKFKADGETPRGIFPNIPGETIAAVLSDFGRRRRPGPLPLREMAVAILLKLEQSDEDPKEVLRSLDAARKEARHPRRTRRKLWRAKMVSTSR